MRQKGGQRNYRVTTPREGVKIATDYELILNQLYSNETLYNPDTDSHTSGVSSRTGLVINGFLELLLKVEISN